jgi:hypothetical protein
MKHFGSSKKVEGSSTAFVNACSLEVGCSFEQHLKHLDTWLETLSSTGLFMGDVTILRRVSDENWGNGLFKQFELFVVYGGLELGDASYSLLPTREQGIVSVSDIGFGLERITWAVSKFPSYFDLLRPITFGLSLGRHAHDILRTVALLTLCGVEASNEGVGFQLRKMCRSALNEHIGRFEAHELLLHCYHFWSGFLKEKRSGMQAVDIFQREMDRLVQAEVAAALKVSKADRETAETYATRLVYTLGVPIGDIQKVLRRDDHD